MPSIFIWKSDRPGPKNSILIYSGSNWVLEDGPLQSYKYVEQFAFKDVLMDVLTDVFVFTIKKMPQNWVGTDFMEVNQVPYEMIANDNYGTLEQLGKWFRFTSNECKESEFISIKPRIQKMMLK